MPAVLSEPTSAPVMPSMMFTDSAPVRLTTYTWLFVALNANPRWLLSLARYVRSPGARTPSPPPNVVFGSRKKPGAAKAVEPSADTTRQPAKSVRFIFSVSHFQEQGRLVRRNGNDGGTDARRCAWYDSYIM